MAQGRIFLETSDKVGFPVASIQHQQEVEKESPRAVKGLFSWVTAYSSVTSKSFHAVAPWDCGGTQIPQNLNECKHLHSSHNIILLCSTPTLKSSKRQMKTLNPDSKELLPNKKHLVTANKCLLKSVITFIISGNGREKREKAWGVVCALGRIF